MLFSCIWTNKIQFLKCLRLQNIKFSKFCTVLKVYIIDLSKCFKTTKHKKWQVCLKISSWRFHIKFNASKSRQNFFNLGYDKFFNNDFKKLSNKSTKRSSSSMTNHSVSTSEESGKWISHFARDWKFEVKFNWKVSKVEKWNLFYFFRKLFGCGSSLRRKK